MEEILFAEGTRFSLIKGLCFRCLITHFQPFRKILMGEIYLLLSKQKLGQSGMNVVDCPIVWGGQSVYAVCSLTCEVLFDDDVELVALGTIGAKSGKAGAPMEVEGPEGLAIRCGNIDAREFIL